MAGYNAPCTIVQWPVGASAIRKGQFVKLSSSVLVPASSQGEAVLGVATEDADASQTQPLSVCVFGECDVEVDDATLIKFDLITPKASGVAEKAAASDVVAGRILEVGAATASSAFEYRRAFIICAGAPYSVPA